MADAAEDVKPNHPLQFGVADLLKLKILHFKHGVPGDLWRNSEVCWVNLVVKEANVAEVLENVGKLTTSLTKNSSKYSSQNWHPKTIHTRVA